MTFTMTFMDSYPRLQARIDSQPPLLTAVAPAAKTRKHVHVSKKSYIDSGDNFNFGELVFLASLIVGELVCRRVVHKAIQMPCDRLIKNRGRVIGKPFASRFQSDAQRTM